MVTAFLYAQNLRFTGIGGRAENKTVATRLQQPQSPRAAYTFKGETLLARGALTSRQKKKKKTIYFSFLGWATNNKQEERKKNNLLCGCHSFGLGQLGHAPPATPTAPPRTWVG